MEKRREIPIEPSNHETPPELFEEEIKDLLNEPEDILANEEIRIIKDKITALESQKETYLKFKDSENADRIAREIGKLKVRLEELKPSQISFKFDKQAK